MTSQTSDLADPGLHATIGGHTRTFPSAAEKFEALAAAWDDHNLGQSVTDYHHDSHLQILGMGGDAIPFLLDRLRRGERRWVYALKCITGEQAETSDMRGNAEKVIAAWLDWGDRRGCGRGRVIGR